MPDIGASFISAAVLVAYCGTQTYVIDVFTTYAASATAAMSLIRNLAGFGFPLFAPAMYNSLGYGWGNTMLSLIAMTIGVPAPWLFWRYGKALRLKSTYGYGD